MQSTRQRIIDYLEMQHSASTIEISRALQMTRANIRHHVNILVEQGKIKLASKIGGNQRGRPTSIYMLTSKSTHNGLSNLSSALFKQILGSRDSSARYKRLQQVANQLTPKQAKTTGPITLKLGQAIDRLNELEYRAHWEAHADGAKIIFRQCPYAEIIGEHPELCQLDRLLINNLIQTSVEQKSKIENIPDGPHQCVFLLSK